MSGVCPNQVSDYLESSLNLLTYCSWSTDQSQEAQELRTTLRNFNNNDFMNNLENATVKTAPSNNTFNSFSETLLLSFLIPGIILIILAIIAVVIFFIKKNRHQQNQVPL